MARCPYLHSLVAKWKVVDDDMPGRMVEDTSIFTIDDQEVLGCSEWIRCEREIFDHIVLLHNQSLLTEGGE